MDGGGRLLRSLGGAVGGPAGNPQFRFASPFSILYGQTSPSPVSPRTRAGAKPATPFKGPRRGWGTVLVVALFGLTGFLGAVQGGEYQSFIAENGAPGDILAKALGFSIETVAISGLKELTPREILDGGDVSPKNSLVLLDPATLRQRLKTIPLVKDATITKLFPHDLGVSIVEREPAALWQNDGQISLIAADGVPIDAVKDRRFNALPFVVGSKANTHLGEFQALLAAAGDLRDRVRAGILVGERRWTLKMESGVQVELPEIGAAEQLSRLASMEEQFKVLEKDVISIDLRIPGRLTARLSEDAAAERAAVLAKKPKKANPA